MATGISEIQLVSTGGLQLSDRACKPFRSIDYRRRCSGCLGRRESAHMVELHHAAGVMPLD
jgi:hypothetical protein